MLFFYGGGGGGDGGGGVVDDGVYAPLDSELIHIHNIESNDDRKNKREGMRAHVYVCV